MTLLARRNKQIESHTTLQVKVDTADLMRSYYFASSSLFFQEIEWEPLLRRASQIRSSLTRASDSATVELTNTDTALGIEFLGLGQSIYGAETKIGRYWKDLESGAEYHKIFLTGVIVGLRVDEQSVQLTAVSEPYAQISVGATRRVVPMCQFTFRNPQTCGYNGSLLVCNFLLNNAGGCDGRHGNPLKFAKFGGFAFLNSGSRLKTL